MKKLSVLMCSVCAIVALCMIVSCEKPLLSEETVSGDADGNLKVTVFEIAKTPFGSLTRGAEPASAVCKRLNFAIYTLDGIRMKQVNQTSDVPGFGTASFQLEEGEYQVVVVGHSSGANPTMTNSAKIQFTNATGYTDTFLYNDVVNIGEESVDLSVALDRITALCRFVITDEIPAEVTKMQFYYTGGSGAFNAATGRGSVASKQTVTFTVTSASEKQFDLYTFLHEPTDEITLRVTALDAAGNELYNRLFDVPMQQNYITWLTGAFFNGNGSSSTTIGGVTVNTDWAGETHITF